MHINRFPLIALAATAVAGAPLVAAAEGDKSDDTTASETTVITAAWYGGEGRPQAQVVERFAEEVDRASGGALQIEINYQTEDWAQRYADGEFDLLLSPTRSLDTMGVDTFVPLTVPFLVNDDDQADRIATSPVVDEMMAGLDAIDSTGLLFAPVYEMHLGIAGAAPLRTIDQLATGMRIAPPGEAIEAVYEALEATPTYGLDDTAWAAAMADGSVAAYEFPTALWHEDSTMAANFALYYEFVVLLARNESLAGLDDSERAIIEHAAATAEQRSLDERLREPDYFRDACANGATLTAMPTTLEADIGRAVDDVIIGLLEDPATSDRYDSIKQAAGARQWAWPDECHDGDVARYEPPAPPSATFPFGSYRAPGRDRQHLVVSGLDNEGATNNQFEYVDFEVKADSVTIAYGPGSSSTSGDTCTARVSVDEIGLITVGGGGCAIEERTYTWHEIDGGIAVELMPTDNVEMLLNNFTDSAVSVTQLLRVD